MPWSAWARSSRPTSRRRRCSSGIRGASGAGSARAGVPCGPGHRRARCDAGAALVQTGRWPSMIDLLVGDDRRSFGIVTALAVEGIPVRRISRASEFEGGVLVATSDRLDGAAAALARQAPTVVVGEGDGAEGRLPALADAPLGLSLDDPIWPASVRALARAHAGGMLRLPQATVHLAPSGLDGQVLATVQDPHGRRLPAV